jgi:hypothetical protein
MLSMDVEMPGLMPGISLFPAKVMAMAIVPMRTARRADLPH